MRFRSVAFVGTEEEYHVPCIHREPGRTGPCSFAARLPMPRKGKKRQDKRQAKQSPPPCGSLLPPVGTGSKIAATTSKHRSRTMRSRHGQS